MRHEEHVIQAVQRVEVFSRSDGDWLYRQYGAGESFHLASLNIFYNLVVHRISLSTDMKQDDKLFVFTEREAI